MYGPNLIPQYLEFVVILNTTPTMNALTIVQDPNNVEIQNKRDVKAFKNKILLKI